MRGNYNNSNNHIQQQNIHNTPDQQAAIKGRASSSYGSL